jgi:hypothetical protein
VTADPYLPIAPVQWVQHHAPGLPDELAPVLLEFAKHADAKGRGAFPFLEEIAASTGRSLSTVKRNVKRLVGMRLLEPGDQNLPARVALPPGKRPVVYNLPVQLRREDAHLAGAAFDLFSQTTRRVTGRDPSPRQAPTHAEAAAWAREIAMTSQRVENCFGPAEFAEMRHHLETALLNGWGYGALIRFLERPSTTKVTRAADLIGRMRANPYPPGDPRAALFKPEPVTPKAAPDKGDQLEPISEWDGWGHVDAIHEDVVPEPPMCRRYAAKIVLWTNRDHTLIDQLHVDETIRLLALALGKGHTSGSLVRLLDEPITDRHDPCSELMSRIRRVQYGQAADVAEAVPAEQAGTADGDLAALLARQNLPVPGEQINNWAGHLIRRTRRLHIPLDTDQTTELHWRLSKALRNGVTPAHLGRLVAAPTSGKQDPTREILERIAANYWPGNGGTE